MLCLNVHYFFLGISFYQDSCQMIFDGLNASQLIIFTSTVLIIELMFAYGLHCVKSVQIRSFFWSAFFRISTDIQLKCGKIRTRKKTSYLDTFHSVIAFNSLNLFRTNARLYFDIFQNVAIAGLKCRSSRRSCSVKKCVLKNFAKFAGKYPC